jgi:uncharacterized protein
MFGRTGWRILALTVLGAASMIAAENRSPEGNWMGTLELPGAAKLRICFRITRGPDGAFKSVLDSPDQGARDIPISRTIMKGDSLILRSAMIGGVYEGMLSKDGKSMTGTWKQGGQAFPLGMTHVNELPAVSRPQEPKPPFPYTEEPIEFRNEDAKITLAGTFTKPSGTGPFPAVVLVSGSGPQDRNETVFDHKPFLVLADHLGRNGIAVLRYDDRGVGASKGDFQSAVTPDFASDAEAAVRALRARKDVDSRRIGVLGHSEGAMVAPMVAAKDGKLAFVVLLAPPGMCGADLLPLQAGAISRADGIPDAVIAKNASSQKRMFGVILEEKDPAKAEVRLRQILSEQLSAMPEEQKKAAEAQIEAQIKQVLSPWFRYFLASDPAAALQKTRCPALALWGEKDLQVPPKENLPLVRSALEKGGSGNVAVEILPGLNHLFQTCKTGSPSEYFGIDETFAPAALKTITKWIRERTGR